MSTRFFVFPDMETSFTLAAAEGMTTVDETGEPRFVAWSHDWACDVVGAVEGRTGWHVNVRTSRDVPASFLPYETAENYSGRDFV